MSIRIRSLTAIFPLVIFPVLTLLSSKLIIAHLFTFEPTLRAQCSQGSSSTSNIPYTGVEALDSQLCFMVAFFHSALDDAFASEFLVYFIGTSSIYVIFPCLEAVRQANGNSHSVCGRMLRYPEAWLALSQVASLGVAMTLYGLVFVLASKPNRPGGSRLESSTAAKEAEESPSGRPCQISGIDAQAIAVATLMGAAVPSLALFTYRDPSITVLWQAFPLYIFLARFGYRRFIAVFSSPIAPRAGFSPAQKILNTTSAQSKGGYKYVRLILLSSVALSMYFHISFLSSILMRPDLASFFKGSPELQGVEALPHNVLVFLLWDFVFSFLSSLLALGFDAIAAGKKVTESKSIVIGCALGCPLVGPGAVVAVCVLRREDRLKSRPIADRDTRVGERRKPKT